MQASYQVLLLIHAMAGTVGLAVFWLPLFVRKGGSIHRRFGTIFITAMKIAGATAVSMTLLLYTFPLESRGAVNLPLDQQLRVTEQARGLADLLLPLGLLLLVNVRQATLVLRHKQDRSPMRLWRHQLPVSALALASLHLAYQAVLGAGALAWVFGVLGLGNALSIWRYVYRSELQKGAWLSAHIANILGAGIGAHTAFLVFGGRNFLAQWMSSDVQLLLWFAPSVVGATAITLTIRHYARRAART